MRFLELNLLRYGCFTNRRLSFPTTSRLVVLYGPNEAGKTTSLRGLTDFLYGIDVRTTQNFVHDNKDLQLEGRLLDHRGTTHDWIRRKRNKQPLEDRAGQAVLGGLHAEILGGVSRETFESLFRMDHAGLVQGGEALREGKGELASSLFHAGAGIPGIQQILQQLEAEAEDLFKPRGSTSTLNKAFAQLEQHRDALRKEEFSASDWKQENQRVTALDRELRDLGERRMRLQSEEMQLSRWLDAQGLAHERTRLLRALQTLPKGPPVPETLLAECSTLEEGVRQTRQRVEQAREKSRRLQQQLAELPEPLPWADQRSPVESLVRKLAIYRSAREDFADVQGRTDSLRAEAVAQLRRVAPQLSLTGVARLLPTPELKRERQRLMTEFIELRAQIEQGLRDRQLRLDQAATEVEAPAPPDPAVLRHLLVESHRQGPPVTRLQAARERLESARRHLSPIVARLAPWRGAPEALATLPVPLLPTVERFLAERTEWERQRSALEQKMRTVEGDLEKAREEAEELTASGAVPTEAELQQARARRDLGWRLIRGEWLPGEGGGGTVAERAAFCEAEPLPEAFERAVRQADEIADRLRREADRVAVQARLQARREGLARQQLLLAGQQQKLEADGAAWQARWEAEWAPCGFLPLSPPEMRGWLEHREAAVERVLDLQQAADGLLECERQVSSQSTAVREELARLGSVPESLARGDMLWSFASQRAEELERDRQEHERQSATRRERRRTLDSLDQQLLAARGALERWIEAWNLAFPNFLLEAEQAAGALAPLSASVELAREWADTLQVVADHLATIAGNELRLAAMQKTQEEFETGQAAVCLRVGRDFTAVSPDVIVEQLERELQQDATHATRRTTWQEQLSLVQGELEQAERDAQQTEARFHANLTSGHATSLSELRELAQQDQQRKSLQAELHRVEADLDTRARGASLEQFTAELTARDVGQLELDLRRVQENMASVDQELQQKNREFGALQQALQVRERSESTAQHAQDIQAEIASIRTLALDYARIRMAATLLRRHLEQYRSRARDPILAETARLFSRLTLGAFESVQTDFDDQDQPVLIGLRPGESRRSVRIHQMSDGTRDQLFLALRLATLRQQFAAGVQLPVVMDDILINFDDDRSAATLEVLAELGGETQVLFFTHHARLVELARQVIPTGDLHVIELERFAG